MTVILLFLRRYWLHLLIGAGLIALCIGGYGWAYGNGYDKAEAKCSAQRVEAAEGALKAIQKVEAERKALEAQIVQADAQHQKELTDAKVAADRLIADLRSGAVKLRARWQGCQATSGLSAAAASAAEPDAAARDREDSAGRIIGAGDAADAQIRALQAIIRAERKQ